MLIIIQLTAVTMEKPNPAKKRDMHNTKADFANIITIQGKNSGMKLSSNDLLRPNFSTAHPA